MMIKKLLLVSIFSAALSAHAAILAEFEFAGSGAADTTITNSDVGSISLDAFDLNGLNEDATRSDVLSVTGAGSSPTDNIEIVLSLGAGETFDFEDPIETGSLSFDGKQWNGGSSPNADFFRAEITAGATTVNLGDSYVDDSASYSLDGLGLSGTNSITLNIYVARQQSWSDASIDNLTLQGTAVPEPSTYAALTGLLALGVVFWRRRRS